MGFVHVLEKYSLKHPKSSFNFGVCFNVTHLKLNLYQGLPKCCIDVVHVVDLWILVVVVVVVAVAVVILGEICLTASSLDMRYNMHAACISFIVDVFVKCLTSIFVCIGYCRPTNLTTWIPNVSTKCISIHNVNL